MKKKLMMTGLVALTGLMMTITGCSGMCPMKCAKESTATCCKCGAETKADCKCPGGACSAEMK